MSRATDFAHFWLFIMALVVAGVSVAAIVLSVIKAFIFSPGGTLLCLGIVVIALITMWALGAVYQER